MLDKNLGGFSCGRGVAHLLMRVVGVTLVEHIIFCIVLELIAVRGKLRLVEISFY